jgi:hypothetical protein
VSQNNSLSRAVLAFVGTAVFAVIWYGTIFHFWEWKGVAISLAVTHIGNVLKVRRLERRLAVANPIVAFAELQRELTSFR